MITRKCLLVSMLVLLAGCGLFDSEEDKLDRARNALVQGDYGEAVVRLRSFLEDAPQDPAARLLLARALHMQGDLPAAERTLQLAVEQGADVRQVAELKAQWDLSGGAYQALLDTVTGGASPLEDWRREYFRARALQGLNRTAEALAIFSVLAAAHPESADLQLRMAQCHAFHGRVAQAGSVLDKALSLSTTAEEPVAAEVWLLRSALAQQDGNPEAVRTAMRNAIELAPGELSALQQGQLLASAVDRALRADDLEEARRYERVLARLLPMSPLLEIVGAQVQLFGEKPEVAVGRLQQLLQEQPGHTAARGLLVAALLRTGGFELALKEAGTLAAGAPGNTAPGQLQQLIRTALDLPADSVERDLAIATATAAAEQPALARLIVRDAVARHGGSDALEVALVRLELANGRAAEALRRARALADRNPDQAAATALLAEMLLANDDAAAAAGLYERLWKEAPTGQLTLVLAQTRRRAGLPGAELPLQQWLQQHPRDLSIRLELASALQAGGASASAVSEYQRVIADAPDGHPLRPIALNNLAVLYSQLDDRRALETARMAHEAAGHVAAIQDTYGWLLTRQGRVGEALPLLEAAAAAAPAAAEIRYHYAAALAASGARGAARIVLADVLLDPEDFDGRTDAQALLARLQP